MSTLAEFMIVAGADNRPPMLDKPMYESWKSRMKLYIQGKDHRRIILNSVENGPLIWPTVEQENDIVRLKTYEELFDKKSFKLIVISRLPTFFFKQERECKLYDEFDKFSHVKGETLYEYYLWFAQLINNMNIIQMTMQPVQVNTKFLNRLPPEWGPRGNTSGQAKVVKCYNCQGEGHMARQCTQPKRRRDASWFKENVLLIQAQAEGKELDEDQLTFLVDPGVADGQVAQIITHNAAFQTDDLDAYDFDCDDISSAKAVLMANLSSCDSDVLLRLSKLFSGIWTLDAPSI
ncbi:integrase, catalytic region, zinc finger, CCHC-type containing protein [Tanacetum coccineum]